MDKYSLLVYIASAIVAIVIYISKSRRQKDLVEKNDDLLVQHDAELVQTKEKFDKQIQDLKQKIEDTDEAKMLRSQLANLKDQLAEAMEVLRKAEVAKVWLSEKPMLEAERKEMEEKLVNLGRRLEEMTQNTISTQKLSDDLTQKAEGLAKEVARMESERGLLGDELDEFSKERNALTTQIEASKKESKTLQDQIEKQEQLKKQLREDCRKLIDVKKRLNALEKQRKELESKVKEFEAVRDALESTKELQKQIGETNKLMMDDLAAIEESRKKGQTAIRQAAFEDLNKNPPFTQPEGNRDFNSEPDALENLKEYVRNVRQYDLPDRLLYAFHTSLKTSDISSLTVMAGVSGTGKSALPDLYAKAMGFHLVTLAVEPRWDSPKDLLGFFNYVTNRYVSTPLARALFQFQGQHKDGGALKPKHDLNNYMLMAMLDEMNLARIEYYFSEFLSKLELRRSGDMNSPAHLGRIATEIFAGASGQEKNTAGKETRFNEPPMHLFADYNTLFVGTMNEDETTQSLSDKVLDRANVLYFGRPGNLKPKTADAGNGEKNMLLRTTWQSWCHNVAETDTEDNGRLHTPAQTLKELNNHLADLGRPFAHRSYQAMLAYLVNYPHYETEREPNNIYGDYKRPLADQIGMRIMPKLRGLDLAQNVQTLERVRGIVGKINDDPLTEAFEKATDRQHNRAGFFHWQGLNWAHRE